MAVAGAGGLEKATATAKATIAHIWVSFPFKQGNLDMWNSGHGCAPPSPFLPKIKIIIIIIIIITIIIITIILLQLEAKKKRTLGN